MKTENWRVGDKKDRAGSKLSQEESKFLRRRGCWETGPGPLVDGRGCVRSGTVRGWRRRDTVETKGAPDPTHIT